ncbi:hypothetical protein D9619_009552 [Psilocybe cf. subviscida]|uniref:Uncharacterized protein n=1 Tax=Psilocybe cf. subviscida TaxID=2480587 RepID=A0A8H5F5X3_9AGAR|nr:hypothetical protein D9619_009552 [Psilocybe cf. subviscida]
MSFICAHRMTLKSPTEATANASDGESHSGGMPIYPQEQAEAEHPLSEDPPPYLSNVDGSDQESVVNRIQRRTKTVWGSLLKSTSMLIVVLTLVTFLHYGYIARQRHQWTQEIRGYEQTRTVHKREILTLVAETEKLVTEKEKLVTEKEKLAAEEKELDGWYAKLQKKHQWAHEIREYEQTHTVLKEEIRALIAEKEKLVTEKEKLAAEEEELDGWHTKLQKKHQWAQEIRGYEQTHTVLKEEIRTLIAEKEKLITEKEKLAAGKKELDGWYAKLQKRRRQIRWMNVTDVGCSAYAKRRHTAILSNVALGLNPEQECRDKALSINGTMRTPTKCEEEMSSGKMIGIWDVASAQCEPRVSKREDEGRYKGTIIDVHDHDNFSKICYTMPGGVVYKGDGRFLSLGEPADCQSECTMKQRLFGDREGCIYWARWNVVDPACT